jgi:pyridoxamine 5'-phosphate oxidase
MDLSIAGLRQEYSTAQLLETNVSKNPFEQFSTWWRQAIDSKIQEPNAMTLATASSDGMPSARIVLLKGFDDNGFVFFTNYQSFKGMQLEENPRACLVFFWKELERQVRVTGLVHKTSDKVSNDYFQSRPKGSQVGAVASPQSQVIQDRQWLDAHYDQTMKEAGEAPQRPAHWGGYVVQPVIFEFWQGRPGRMHDRLQYNLQDGNWNIERLAP